MLDLVSLVVRLAKLGWVSGNEITAFIKDPSASNFIKAIKKFQEFHCIPGSGNLDETTVRTINATRMCGCHDRMEMMELRWPSPHPVYLKISDPWPIPRSDVWESFRWATSRISRVCDVSFELVSELPARARSSAVIRCVRLDGKGGVLAQSQLATGYDATLSQEYDNAEVYATNLANGKPPGNLIDLPLVALHELCHLMGVPHIGGSVAVMNPTYNPALGDLQIADIEQLVRRYGLPKSQPEPPTPNPKRVIITGHDLEVTVE